MALEPPRPDAEEAPPALALAGFQGLETRARHVLKVLPDNSGFVAPCGSALLVYSLKALTRPAILSGHTQPIACVALSASGRYAATGTATHLGFASEICVWDLERRERLHTFALHKTETAALAFSEDEQFLASIGGADDSRIIVWDVLNGAPIAANQIYMKPMRCVSFLGSSNTRLATAGDERIYVWTLDLTNRVISHELVNMGQLKRVYTDMVVEADPIRTSDGELAYLATQTGDVVFVNMRGHVYKGVAPGGRRPLPCPVECVATNSAGNVVAAASDGTLVLVRRDNFAIVQRARLEGHVTSLSRSRTGTFLLAATREGSVFRVDERTFEARLLLTAPTAPVAEPFFAPGLSRLFVAAGGEGCSVWDTQRLAELLRVRVPSVGCTCGAVSPDGGVLATGWTDGAIRAFGPQTGRLLFTIRGAHGAADGLAGVSCLCYAPDPARLFSGGDDGRIREWRIAASHQTLVSTVSMHTRRVTALRINRAGTELISSSRDGSCQVFELPSLRRLHELHDDTEFAQLAYSDDETQLVAVGSDHFVSWWNVVSGEQIRKLELSRAGELTACDLSPCGNFVAVGSNDTLVRIVGYDTGDVVAVGQAHSMGVLAARFSPDGRVLVSTALDGSVAVWDTAFLAGE